MIINTLVLTIWVLGILTTAIPCGTPIENDRFDWPLGHGEEKFYVTRSGI